jgi:hypothetical protein
MKKIKLYFATNRKETIYNLTWEQVKEYKKLGYPRHGTMQGLEDCKKNWIIELL